MWNMEMPVVQYQPPYDVMAPHAGLQSDTTYGEKATDEEQFQVIQNATFRTTYGNGPGNEWKQNKLGGTYHCGKPLPHATRVEIINMVKSGEKTSDIARKLQISYGCVSKILNRWRATGSVNPGHNGGSKPRRSVDRVVTAVLAYKLVSPSIRACDIRRKLLDEGHCTENNVPSLSSINRIIRLRLRNDLAEAEAKAVQDLVAILSAVMPAEAECQSSSPHPSGHGHCQSEPPEPLPSCKCSSPTVFSQSPYAPPASYLPSSNNDCKSKMFSRSIKEIEESLKAPLDAEEEFWAMFHATF